MFRVLFVLWLTCLATHPAYAGAWLREKGKGFLAYSNLTASTLDTTFSAYFDYGLSERATIGATLDFNTPLYGYPSGKALLFMRRSLGWGGADANWTYELGFGGHHTGLELLPVAKTTLSYGRGITWGKRNGWLAIDAGIEWDLGHSKHMVKIDSTLGMELGARSKGMLQIFNTYGDTWNSITLSPSYIFQTKKKKKNYVVGFEANSLTPKTVAIKIGVWQTF